MPTSDDLLTSNFFLLNEHYCKEYVGVEGILIIISILMLYSKRLRILKLIFVSTVD